MLIHAANAYEERKVRHIGWFYASLVFESAIGPGYANLLLALIDRLTYRGIVGIALFGTDRYRNVLARIDVARSEGDWDARAASAAIAHVDELGSAGVLGVSQEERGPASMYSVVDGGTFQKISLARAVTTRLGDDLYVLMRLDRVPATEMEDMLLELGARPDSIVAQDE